MKRSFIWNYNNFNFIKILTYIIKKTKTNNYKLFINYNYFYFFIIFYAEQSSQISS